MRHLTACLLHQALTQLALALCAAKQMQHACTQTPELQLLRAVPLRCLAGDSGEVNSTNAVVIFVAGAGVGVARCDWRGNVRAISASHAQRAVFKVKPAATGKNLKKKEQHTADM